MRNCQECGRAWPTHHDICPDCWEPTQENAPEPGERLRLVYQTHTPYEAEMVQVMLRNEGIPCLKIPGQGAVLWPVATASPLTQARLYVHAGNFALAQSLVDEITGGEHPDTKNAPKP